MADDGAPSGATTPARVSSYEASELRLQESSKAMIEAYHRMMASADRLIASFDRILSLENSGSTTIIDHGEQDAELCQSKTDSRLGQEYEASTIAKIQMESPIVPDSTEIIDQEEIEGQDPQISVTEGSNQGRIPNPSNDVFPKLEGAGDPTISWGITIRGCQEFNIEAPWQNFKDIEAPRKDVTGNQDDLHPQFEPKENPEVITYPLEIVVEVESDEIYGWADYRTISIETLGNSFAHLENLIATEAMISVFKGKFVECLEVPVAPKVFVEMPAGLGMVERGTNVSSGIVESSSSIDAVIGKQKALDGNWVFDSGGSLHVRVGEIGKRRVIDMVSTDQFGKNLVMGALLTLHLFKDRLKSMPFDRGRATAISMGLGGLSEISHIGSRLILVFDPGGGYFGHEPLAISAAFCKEISGLFVHQQGN